MTRPIRSTYVGLGALAVLTSAAAWGLSPSAAHAFSDSTMFGQPIGNTGDPPQAGGGEGRYFTGSPSDGYTCAVCHQGGKGPALRILGLPLGGYQLGASYEITVDWPDNLEHVSLAVEISDQSGAVAGDLKTPAVSSLPLEERCPGPQPIGALLRTPLMAAATQTQPLMNRVVIQMPDCGARQGRFLWTAPMTDVGPVWLSGAVVATDGMSDTLGDGVTTISRAISSPTSPPLVASQLKGGCSIATSGTPPRSRAPLYSWLAAIAALLLTRRRRRA